MRPAGFWRRCAAWSLDAGMVALPAFALSHRWLQEATHGVATAGVSLSDTVAQRLLASLGSGDDPMLAAFGLMRDPQLLAGAGELQSALLLLLAAALAGFVPLFLAWCVAFESSRWRATPGKRALGLQVVAADGSRAGPATVLLRFLAGSLSWLTLNLGHLVAAMPPDHAALHDRLCGTRVRLAADAGDAMPRWAVWWLSAVAAAMVAAQLWLMLAFQRTLLAALDAALYL